MSKIVENLLKQDKLLIHLFYGFLVRILLILWSCIHDIYIEPKYTDIDYVIYTGAAKYITMGESPYNQETYRYTPLLAQILTANVYINNACGKIIFVIFDIGISWLIYKSVRYPEYRLISALMWLYNPMVMAISTRGSSESVIVFLVLCSVYFLKRELYLLAGFFHGLAIHFKIYPLTYSPLIYFALGNNILTANRKQSKFLLMTIITFLSFTASYYNFYGWEFLEETYFYHVYRQDPKHNFSVFWYIFYHFENISVLGYVPFITQSFCMIFFTYRYSTMVSLEFGMFVIVYSFVTLNKVVTAQYFLWYFSFVPLIWYDIEIPVQSWIVMFSFWALGITSFLFPAYLLEFQHLNVHFFVFLGCLSFFVCNCYILNVMVKSYIPRDRSSLKIK
ncbi:GPI mannosyltransferase 1-like [Artemia franciscana]|uniref:GPI mannosyltransferase 1-like n=1 Tax=Artemia franciscana TaxID=6661 RepID=UPI0032DB19CE